MDMESREKLIRFRGNIKNADVQFPEFAATLGYDRFDPTTLSTELFLLGSEDDCRRAETLLRYFPQNLRCLNNLDSPIDSVELFDIYKVSRSRTVVTIEAREMRVGLTDEPLESDETYSVIVELQPGGLVSFPEMATMHCTGEIRHEQVETGRVSFASSFGELEVSTRYTFYSTVELGDEVTHRVLRCGVAGSLKVPKGASLFDLNESFCSDLDKVCVALSLAYRQPVDYYEIQYYEDRPAPDGESRSPFLRRRLRDHKQKRSGDELINVRSLSDGGLQQLVDAIYSARESVGIVRAIGFLAASSEASLETAYFMAFAAMETIVDACLEGQERTVLGSSQWKKAERKLKSAIDFLALGPPGEVVKSKLPELRRRSLSDRMKLACDRLKPKLDDLWPAEGLEVGFKRAAEIRNGLFHASEAHEVPDMAKDLLRIRTLAERLLLRELRWPDENIWVWYDQDLKWANSESTGDTAKL